jgi:alpha-L-rhamnosidase
MGIPTDCPQREKNGWTGDAQVACEQGLFYGDGITLYEAWMNDFGDEQFITGALPGIIPTSGQWGYGFGSGPAWDSAYLLIPWHLYEYYGDPTALKRHYEGLKKYVDYLTSRARDGIVGIGLGDWMPAKTETSRDITDTAYYFRDAQIVAAVARMLGREADATKYALLAGDVRTAFNRAFYHPEDGTYGSGSQTALGAALYFKLVEPENETRVLENLVHAIEKNDRHLDYGFLGSKYVPNSLTAHGYAELGYEMINQATPPSYAYQIAQGATTLWEGWVDAPSRNHTFFGDVNAWMMKTLAGINFDPDQPGFQHIRITPHVVADLQWAKGTFDSVHGRIASAWSLQGDSIRFEITIPANTTATCVLPGAAKVTESGRPAAEAPGVIAVQGDSRATTVEIGSGSYVFTAERRVGG